MTRPSRQKIRVKRAAGAPTAGYFAVRPAELAPDVAAQGLRAHTKSGVRGAPGVDEAQLVLARTMRKARVSGEVLDLMAMGGLIGSLPGVTLRAVEGSAPALAALRAGGFDPEAAAPGDDLRLRWPERARTVALVLSGDRGNAYAYAQVAWAHACTPPGGTLYLAGDRDKGYDRYVRAAADAFGAGETITRDGRLRVGRLTRRPGPTPPLPAPETYETHGLKVVGLPGVFSAARLDKASALLLDTLGGEELGGQRVLDLGCGAGVLGAWAAGRGAHVTLADADLQSVRSARATLEANALPGDVVHSDVDAALGEARFDVLLTNPPFHVGRGTVLDVALEFIAAAGRRLVPGGRLRLVANDLLPYEAPLRALGELRELRREGGYKVLELRRPPLPGRLLD